MRRASEYAQSALRCCAAHETAAGSLACVTSTQHGPRGIQQNMRRSATLRTSADSLFCVLSRERFTRFIALFPEKLAELRTMAQATNTATTLWPLYESSSRAHLSHSRCQSLSAYAPACEGERKGRGGEARRLFCERCR